MKLTKIANLILLGAALTFTVTGCHKKPQGITPLTGSRTKGPGAGNESPIGAQAPISGGDTTGATSIPNPNMPTPIGGGALGPGHEGYKADTEALKAQTIHFAFDKSAIRSDDKPKLDEVANYLKSNPNAALRVEGNCDERGTEEYNRSLGERRALAAREYLVKQGIDAGRIDTVSYGFDHPVDPAHNEAAWSANRRDDFVVLTPP